MAFRRKIKAGAAAGENREESCSFPPSSVRGYYEIATRCVAAKLSGVILDDRRGRRRKTIPLALWPQATSTAVLLYCQAAD